MASSDSFSPLLHDWAASGSPSQAPLDDPAWTTEEPFSEQSRTLLQSQAPAQQDGPGGAAGEEQSEVPTSVVADTSPPQILAVSLSTHTVDLNEPAARQIALNLWLSDDSSGINNARFTFRNTRTGTTREFAFTPDNNLVAGTRMQGWLSSSLSFAGYRETEIRTEDVGEWRFESAEIRDRANNVFRSTAPLAPGNSPLASLAFEVIHSGQVEDTTPPAITAASFSASSLDLADPASHEIVLNLGIRDADSGFSQGWVTLESEDGNFKRWIWLNRFAHLSAGSEREGTFSGSTRFNPHVDAGTWRIKSLSLYDNSGQWLASSTDLDSLLPSLSELSFTLINSNQETDHTAPQLISVSLDKPRLDLSDPSQRSVVITMQLSDDISGFDYGYLSFRSADGSGYVSAYASQPRKLVSGSATNGTFTANLNFDAFAAAGEWKLNDIYLVDRAGNARYSYGDVDALLPGLSALSIQVERSGLTPPSGPDTQRPELKAISLNGTDFYLEPGQESILTLSMVASDDNSGVSYGSFGFTSPSGLQSFYLNASNLLSGDLKSGSFFDSSQLPAYSESGFWTLSYASIEDRAGNNIWSAEASEIDTLLPGLSTLGFTIHNQQQDLEAPHVQAALLSAERIDLNQTSPPPLILTLSIDDAPAGYEGCWILFSSPSGNQSLSLYADNPLDGNRNNGRFFGSSYLSPFSEAGIWKVDNYGLRDRAGNERRGDRVSIPEIPLDPIVEAIQGLSFEVINNNQDILPPELTFASLSQSSIDASAAELTPLSLTIGARDNLAGFDSGYFSFRSPSGLNDVGFSLGKWSFIDGDLREGTFFGTLSSPPTWELGTWTLNYATLRDGAGNNASYYDHDQLENLLPGLGNLSFEVLAAAAETNQIFLTLTPQTVHEKGQESLVYTASRTGDLSQALQVNYRVGGSAIPGIDYSGISATPLIQTLDFAAGVDSVTITVTPLVDELREGAETVSLLLMPGAGYSVASIAPVVGTLEDNNGQALFGVEGSASVGGSLSARLQADDPEGNGSFAYFWESSLDGTSWQPIRKGGASVVVTHAEQGRQLRLQIDYTDGAGYAEHVSLPAGTVPAGPAPGHTTVGLDRVTVNESPVGGLFSAQASLSQQADGLPLQAIAVAASSLDLGGSQSFSDDTVTIHAEVSTGGATASAVGLSGSTLQLRPGNDALVIEAAITGTGPGGSVAVRDSRVSGNRGDDTITLRGDFWGDRALIFGGAGNDSITGYGIGRDCFLQAGDGDDIVSLGRLETTPNAAPLQRAKGNPIPPSTYLGGPGFDVLQLRETTQADFSAQATAISDGSDSGWLFQGARFLGFEQFLFG